MQVILFVFPGNIFCESNSHYLLWQSSKFCESTRFNLIEDNKICHDYQEIKIQESTQLLGVGAIPRSIPVILKDDLVDMVKAGGAAFQLPTT